MPNDVARFDAMLFDYKTTNNTDFKTLKFEPVGVKSSLREKKRVTKAPPYKKEKDIHTLVEWNGPKVPFDLLWGPPKDIVRTDPRKIQQPFPSKPEDLGRKEAQLTRPRLVMTPSISLDEIMDDDCGACKVTAQVKKTRDMAKKKLPN